MTSFTLLVCFPATARCVCRLRVHKVSKQVNLVSKHQRTNAISALLCCSCISISWNFPETSRKFFAELFRKSTAIFPEIYGKIPQEISGNFWTHNPTLNYIINQFGEIPSTDLQDIVLTGCTPGRAHGRTYASAHGRTARKHNASADIYL